MSTVIHYSLTQIGGYLMLIGNFISAGSGLVLSDDSAGSPRQVGIALGLFVAALGAYLVAKGHSQPVIQQVKDYLAQMKDVIEETFERGSLQDAQADQSAPKPPQA